MKKDALIIVGKEFPTKSETLQDPHFRGKKKKNIGGVDSVSLPNEASFAS